MKADRGDESAQSYQRLLELRSTFPAEPLVPLAHLGLARAYALEGEKTQSRIAYQDFLALWKDADPDVPLLREAKAEYAKLRE